MAWVLVRPSMSPKHVYLESERPTDQSLSVQPRGVA